MTRWTVWDLRYKAEWCHLHSLAVHCILSTHCKATLTVIAKWTETSCLLIVCGKTYFRHEHLLVLLFEFNDYVSNYELRILYGEWCITIKRRLRNVHNNLCCAFCDVALQHVPPYWQLLRQLTAYLLLLNRLAPLRTRALNAAQIFFRGYPVCSQSRNSPHFMEPEGSLPHSQVPATCLYLKPVPSSPYPHIQLPEDPS